MKHSLAVEFRLKGKKVPSLIINGFNLRSCFLLRQKCILGRSLPPLGLYYSPRFARGCKADPRGVKTALGYTFPWAGINFLGEIHFRCRKVPFFPVHIQKGIRNGCRQRVCFPLFLYSRLVFSLPILSITFPPSSINCVNPSSQSLSYSWNIVIRKERSVRKWSEEFGQV